MIHRQRGVRCPLTFGSFIHPGRAELTVPEHVGLVGDIECRGGAHRLHVNRIGWVRRVRLPMLTGVTESKAPITDSLAGTCLEPGRGVMTAGTGVGKHTLRTKGVYGQGRFVVEQLTQRNLFRGQRIFRVLRYPGEIIASGQHEVVRSPGRRRLPKDTEQLLIEWIYFLLLGVVIRQATAKQPGQQ